MGRAREALRGAVAALIVGLAVPIALPQTARSCKPAVTIFPAATSASNSAVSVYWDISGSMTPSEKVTKQVIDTLDSSILQFAEVTNIQHYTVGDVVKSVKSARDVRVDTSQDTALHKAALHIGQQLASGSIGAAVLISDLDLEIPRRDFAAAEVCSGVPMPANPKAGAIFGRCLRSGFAGSNASTLDDVIIHTFVVQPGPVAAAQAKKKTQRASRPFFVMLIARDVALGKKLIGLMGNRWRSINVRGTSIVDSNQVTAGLSSTPVTCSWSDDSLYEIARSSSRGPNACRFLCTSTDGRARLTVTLPSSASTLPVRLGVATVKGDATTARMAKGEILIDLYCPKPARRIYQNVGVTVNYGWVAVDYAPITQSEEANELFDGLINVLPRLLTHRSIRIALDQR